MDAIATHDGARPVETGEGDAVACALQRAQMASIRLRIGVHTGDVRLLDESNYIGPTIIGAAPQEAVRH